MSRYISILEISQKQAYIFSSNKLADNIINSAVIAYVLSPEYIEAVLAETGYSNKENLVYSGGGHTVLQFNSAKTEDEMEDQIPEDVRRPISVLTENIYRNFDGLEVFAKTLKYDEAKTPKDNLKELTKALESKKSLRLSAFRQGTYGIEKIDPNTLDVSSCEGESEEKKKLRRDEEAEEKNFYPDDCLPTAAFGDLGGSRDEKNFIAVVHIDGNGMGRRVEKIYDTVLKGLSWDETRKGLKNFSDAIDRDFKAALRETAEELGAELFSGRLNDLDKKVWDRKVRPDGKVKFPLRRVISAGDDICFVTEGRIGIECAAVFIRKLAAKVNEVDNEPYCASAGVAIVHQKYPFYKAYELAEMLCSNAKKFGALVSEVDNGARIGAIDWHIEYGEIKDSLKEIRKDYETADGNRVEMRPYIVTAPKEIMDRKDLKEKLYDNFKSRFKQLKQKNRKDPQRYAIGKIKELRSALKEGEDSAQMFLTLNRISDLDSYTDTDPDIDTAALFKGKAERHPHFAEQIDGRKRSLLFDEIEVLDAFLPFGEEESL